ncbi:hypothetical protein KAX17_09265 [Candidatus Bipolaricaulota bacterium]|nr:hypothetical protein [Candidatus Bipolaricaulota bacterium]
MEYQDEAVHKKVIARIEKALRGKADGKGYTDEELETYFKESNEQMSKILTRDDFNRGCDRILRKQAKLLAILTRMEQGLRCDGAVEKDADKIKAGKG